MFGIRNKITKNILFDMPQSYTKECEIFFKRRTLLNDTIQAMEFLHYIFIANLQLQNGSRASFFIRHFRTPAYLGFESSNPVLRHTLDYLINVRCSRRLHSTVFCFDRRRLDTKEKINLHLFAFQKFIFY